MRKFVASFVLGLAITCFASVARAELTLVTVNFEYLANQIGENDAWSSNSAGRTTQDYPEGFGTQEKNVPYSGAWGDGIATKTTFTVEGDVAGAPGVTFTNYKDQGYGAWYGTALSTVSDTTYTQFADKGEVVSVTGSGKSGSVYGVMYADSTANLPLDSPMLPVMMFSPGVELVSMVITNTVWTWDALTNGDWVATPVSEGTYLNLFIYGFDANGNQTGQTSQMLGSANDGILDDWVTVNFDETFFGTTELRFVFDSNDVIDYTTWGLDDLGVQHNQPLYFAFDDIVYWWDNGSSNSVPEPATLVVLGLGLAGLGWARRRKAEPRS